MLQNITSAYPEILDGDLFLRLEDFPNALGVDAHEEVVGMIRAVAGKIEVVLALLEFELGAGDVDERDARTLDGERLVADVFHRLKSAGLLRIVEHRRDDDEFGFGRSCADDVDDALDVFAMVGTAFVGAVVHAEGDDDEVGLEGGNLRLGLRERERRGAAAAGVIHVGERDVEMFAEFAREELRVIKLPRRGVREPARIIAGGNRVAENAQRERGF